MLDTTFEEFDLGTKDLGSVIDAHLDYISTKKSMISTTYDLLLAHFRVLEGIGVLSDEILKDKREEIWGKNKIDIEEVVKNNTDELVFSYNTLQNKELPKEEPLLEHLEESVSSEPLESTISSIAQSESVLKELSFKEKFLQAPQEKYTINLATFSTQEGSERFIKENNISESSFAFLFGQEEQYYKVMCGIFNSYNEAKEFIKNLSEKVQKENQPRIEPISIKQNLYKKYNEKE